MIITNTESIPGHEIKEILGIVMGSTVRAKHLGKDITAGLKSIVPYSPVFSGTPKGLSGLT